jgi:hypothetical protein
MQKLVVSKPARQGTPFCPVVPHTTSFSGFLLFNPLYVVLLFFFVALWRVQVRLMGASNKNASLP